MQYLKVLNRNSKVSIYELLGDYDGNIKRYAVSTPETRSICNKPELLGCEYTNLMRDGMIEIVKSLPFSKDVFLNEPEDSICILNFLRGGLNFDLRSVLNISCGLNRHRTSFMTSQRFKEGGRWGVKENAYRKFSFPKDSTIVIADVVATGVTIDSGLAVLLEHLHKNRASVKRIIFFTIGCHKVEKIFDKYHAAFKELSKKFEGTYIVYLEGKFKLVDSKAKLKIGIPGTDLVRFDSVLTPEFELSQYESLNHPLERCTIYDAGSRAFDVPEYLDDVVEYWTKVQTLANKGFTLYDALKERFPETEYQDKRTFLQTKKRQWIGIDEKFLNELYSAYQKRWTANFLSSSKSKNSLKELVDRRLKVLCTTWPPNI